MKKQKVQWFWKKDETKTYKTYDVDVLSEDIEVIISERLEAVGEQLRGDRYRSGRYCPACYLRDIVKEITDEIGESLKYNSID